MSALARFCFANGVCVSGSDKESSYLIEELQKEGISNIWTPHNTNKLISLDPDYVIYSTAIITNNEELNWSRQNQKIILHRSELLEIITNNKKLISISGTHGKTTTSAMVTEILLKNNMDPSAIIGGILNSRKTNTIVGNGEYFVIEADESDKSFLKGDPELAVITNIEADHLENYTDGLEEIKDSFIEFAKKALSNSGLIFCLEDKVTREIVSSNFDLANPKIISYSLNYPSIFHANYNSGKGTVDIFLKNEFKTSFIPGFPGRHNILNALAAFCVGYRLGIRPEKIKSALEGYEGVKRRFQIIGKTKDLTVIDDYAHHPTEIAMTIKAAKELNPKRLVVVLQPHQPLRLKYLWDDFKEVLKNEDSTVLITDTYIARGGEINGITSKKLVEEIKKPNIKYLSGTIKQIAKEVTKQLQANDLVLILGAGNITNLGPELLKLHRGVATKSGNN